MKNLKNISLKITCLTACLTALLFWHCVKLPDHCSDYNPLDPNSQFCHDGYAVDKCGGRTYNPPSEFCYYGAVYRKCNGETYTPPNNPCEPDNPNPTTYYTLTVSRNPTAGGTVSPSGASTRTAGTPVSISASANSGYTFQNWTITAGNGNIALPTSANTTVTASADVTVTANFVTATVTPPTVSTFTDSRDGKTYKKVTIGTQTWMAENLNYATSSNSWCYGDDASNCNKYGRLYTWDAAMSACPSGWKLPTNAEWTTLVNYVGGGSTAGTQLKAGSPDWDGTNNHGFSALPGGYRYYNGSFNDLGLRGNWWSATEDGTTHAICWRMSVGYAYALPDEGSSTKSIGYSARCLQD